MRQGMLQNPTKTICLRRRMGLVPVVLRVAALLAVTGLVIEAKAGQPPLWGYHMYLGPGDYRVFPNAGAAAAFSCTNINNAEGGAVESITQNGVNLAVACSYEDVNGEEAFGAGRGATWGSSCPPGTVRSGEMCRGFDENSKPPCPDPQAGNPVNTLTGVKIQRETDYASRGGDGLRFERYFDSRRLFEAGQTLGPHWRHNFDTRLRFAFKPVGDIRSPLILSECDQVTRVDDSGISQAGYCVPETFQTSAVLALTSAILERPGEGKTYFYLVDEQWQAGPGRRDKLRRLPVTGAREHWRYENGLGMVELFDRLGRLVERIDNGRHTSFYYDLSVSEGGDGIADTLDKVVADNGRTLRFIYADGLLVEFIDPAGARYRYAYSASAPDDDAMPGQLLHVGYPGTVTGSEGDNNPWGDNAAYRSYHYEHPRFPRLLTGITNENRQRFVSWDYDAQRRAVLSREHGATPAADKVVQLDYQYLFDSDAPRVLQTGALGRETVYHFEEIDGRRLVSRVEGRPHTHGQHPDIQCDAAEQFYRYNSAGGLESMTDWEGNVTTFTRDAQGRETSRTEGLRWAGGQVGAALEGYATAATTVSHWHPLWNKVTRVVGPYLVHDRRYDCDTGLLLEEARYAPGLAPAYAVPDCDAPP